jgi:histidinol-phosphatase
VSTRIEPRDLSNLLGFAVDLSREAGELTLRWFGSDVRADSKGDGTPVTEADRSAERHLRAGIEARFPRDGILGEEFGDSGGDEGYRWILDPIDGTRSFVRGVPLYGVLVGLERRGEPVLGVLHFPALGETVAAASGQGCYLNGRRTGVNEVADLHRAVALTSDPRDAAEGSMGEGWRRLTREVDYVRGWGDAYGHALVATGRAEVMVDPELEVWDAAPLLPIMEEAGGRFTSLSGERTIHGRSGISTNGRLHEQVMRLLGAS